MTGLRFLPWVRSGLSRVITHVGDASALPVLRAELTLHATFDGTSGGEEPRVEIAATAQGTLHGPGDVRTLDERQILRKFPAPGAENVEPTQFAAIEFDRPDLPWLYTPARPNPEGRLRPWLVLVVVPEGASGRLLEATPSAPPRLETRLAELPPLEESWAWAHAQVLVTSEAESANDSIANAPERTLSRLLCPRRLQSGMSYLAALVPAFHTGVQAGLGLPIDESGELRPAWNASASGADPDDIVVLPAYAHWRFRTGPDGDFESLARRLRARPLPRNVGKEPVDIAAGGSGLPPLEPPGVPGHSVLDFEGALGSPDTTPTVWKPEAKQVWQQAMRGLLEHHSTRLTPPLYGSIHRGVSALPSSSASTHWLSTLNLDPRYRATAALGTRVVQKNQEDLADAAWQAAAEVRKLNERLQNGQAARETASALFAKRIDPTRPGRALNSAELTALSRPVHTQLPAPPSSLWSAQARASFSGGRQSSMDGDTSLADTLARNPGARAATSASFRRLTRPRGPLARRSEAVSSTTVLLPRLASGESAVPPSNIPGQGSGFDSLSPKPLRALTPESLLQGERWWQVPEPPAAVPVADDPMVPIASNGGDAVEGRFCVSGADGHLFEFIPSGNDGGWWADHDCPPGTRVVTSAAVVPRVVAGNPTSARYFVRTSSSQLWERSFDGDRWVWIHRGAPPGGVRNRPVTKDDDSYPDAAVYALGGDGNLHRYLLASGQWQNLGRPPLAPGERLWGAPSDAGGSGAYVSTSGSSLFHCDCYDPNQITWSLVRGPSRPPAVWGSVTRVGSNLAWITPDGQLALDLPGFDARRPAYGPVVSIAQSGIGRGTQIEVYVLASSGTGTLRLCRLRSVPLPPPHGLGWAWDEDLPQPPQGFARRRPAPLASTGRLFAIGRLQNLISWKPGTDAWVDHGMLLDRRGRGWSGERGTPGDPKLYAPRIGFLSSMVIAYQNIEGPFSSRWVRGHTGHRLNEQGAFRDGYTAMWSASASSIDLISAALSYGFISGGSRPDVLQAELTPVLGGARSITLRLGRQVNDDGASTTAWTSLGGTGAFVNPAAKGLDLSIADLDRDGRPEVIVAYGVRSENPQNNRVYYRVGFHLDTDGVATRGFTDSIATPHTFHRIDGVSVEVVDVTGDNAPDIVFFVHGTTATGSPFACYFIGKSINRRGRVLATEWTAPIPVPGAGSVSYASGGALSVCDVTGTRRPDFVVSRLAVDTARRKYWFEHQIGFDIDPQGIAARWQTYPSSQEFSFEPGKPPSGLTSWVGDVHSGLIEARRNMGDDFLRAAVAHQQYVLRGEAQAIDVHPEPVSLDETADVARSGLEPETAVAGEVLARLTLEDTWLVDALPDTSDPLRRLVRNVTFPIPAYELLRGLGQRYLVPNLPAVPPDTVTALAANPRFIEAFLVGLNHEMSREMTWREFPADPRQTWFRQFWDVRGAAAASGRPLTDIPPLTDLAFSTGELGSHATSIGAPGEQSLVLVVRGELLRRYPSTIVTLRQAAWLTENKRVPVGDDVLPIFHAYLSPDLLLFGFPLTAEQARGAPSQAQGPAGSFFMFREQPTSPRFGLHQAPADWDWSNPPPWSETRWDDLHWGYLPEGARFLSPNAPGLAGRSLDGASYGRNAADMARVTLQRPVLLAFHASDLLLPPASPSV